MATVMACILYLSYYRGLKQSLPFDDVVVVRYAPLLLLELIADLSCSGSKSADTSSIFYSCQPFREYDGYTLVYKVIITSLDLLRS